VIAPPAARAGAARRVPALLAAGALAALLVAVVIAAFAGSGAVLASAPPAASGPSALATAEIPPAYLALFRAAAERYGIDWTVLAAIAKVECDDGRDPDPSCTEEGAVNGAGAGGPMQFLASTWRMYGVDGDGDGRRDRWDPADAIFSAANYLRASGAPANYGAAILAYNHAGWYVREVEALARRYAGAQPPAELQADGEEGALAEMQARTPTPVRLIEGERAALAPGDGHLALIPARVPPAVQAMLIAGNELQDLPYGPDGHPNPVGATEQDCSSTINYVLFRAGIRPLSEIVSENPVAQDYVGWGAPGPGRWVTLYATDAPTPHVFATIAGLRLDTSHDGTDTGPNRDQDGPRWRIFAGIPAWAHWSVRHPPGL
jgi:soluble lytic murein transglycosylase-like protein